LTIQREIESVRNNVGIWKSDETTILQLSGKDAITWLNNQSSNDVINLENGQGCLNALLDRLGCVQAWFACHRWEEEIWISIQKTLVPIIHQRLDTHVFLEEVYCNDVSSDTPHIHIEGPRSALVILETTNILPTDLPAMQYSFVPVKTDKFELLLFKQGLSSEESYTIISAPGETDAVYNTLLETGLDYALMEISEPAREVLRVESGTPLFPVDIDNTIIISETMLENDAVNYNKGCYLGQEVVARLKNYGTPKKALVGLKFSDPSTALPKPGTILLHNGKKAGEIRSSAYSPALETWIALAYLDRHHRTPGTAYQFTSDHTLGNMNAEVCLLPFVTGTNRSDLATTLYDQALQIFEADDNDEDDTAITLLKEAIQLNPAYEDAYEALGVILHRHHRVDEAIHYMQLLATLNPNCVMAHTNLSVFYVSKGMIQEAESEKALANQLEMKQKLDVRDAEKLAQLEREKIRLDAEERIGMFLEVLEFDPEDPVATMGLGSAYIQLERYEDAIPYLQQATKVKKDFSAAFLNLGKCYEFLGRLDEAGKSYTEGIEVASRKGDLMPLREMERRLKSLQ